MAVNIVAVLPRTGAIVLAVVLLIVSAATIGVINNNEGLRNVRDYDGPTTGNTLIEDVVELQGLIVLTQDSAAWLIVMTIGIVIAEAIAIVLIIIDLQGNGKLIVGILEIIFSVLVILSYLATGIASAAYAAAWDAPPDLCEFVEDIPGADEDDPCDRMPLTATTALQAVFCFIQIGVFGVIVVLTILGIVRSRSESSA
ncbi:hypothetical protein GBAR_LOCUS2117 [Geodia barretti]|uniref:Uncharacterized protein n=1 Tax=Geodia barretti TaxID=519541 RepID=A0AA35QZC0_GEOBA|nr:hypothetical protein GBAR_LOCUS2117 [Geodia barretti]